MTKHITIAGAGITGLWQARTLLAAGFRVRLVEASEQPFSAAASRFAGAMLAPECEAEGAPPIVRDLGRQSLALWQTAYQGITKNGTLVVAQARDKADLLRFQNMTEGYRLLGAAEIATLEPGLADRFSSAIFYESEAHMDAMAAMRSLLQDVRDHGGYVQLGVAQSTPGADDDYFIDCRGIGGRDQVSGLRGVRGERVIVKAPDVDLKRPVRLLHPRQPIYVVGQGDGRYVIGASVIERDDPGAMTVRSALELLGSAYALHSGFSEAEIVDMGAGVRPAFGDNIPRVVVEAGGRVIRVNGMYRHGFLLAPLMAQAVLGVVLGHKGQAPVDDLVHYDD